jgi:hypothetical protein
MHTRFRQVFPLALVVIGLASSGIHAQKGPALGEVLQSAADYLAQYSQKLGVIAAEEEYTQYDTSSGQVGTPTRLITDFVLVGFGGDDVAGFRDVVSTGGAAVRKRDDRLATVFTASPATSLQQARQMSDDCGRYYVSTNLRVMDQPTIALEFFRKENQDRSTFKLDSVKTIKGATVAIVKFTERNTPRLVASPENGPAEGRVWIDVATGTIRETELTFTGKSANIRVTVNYAAEPKLGIWLPSDMYQQVDLYAAGTGASNMGAGGGYGAHQGLEGRTAYGKFRQVTADVSKIK